MTSVNSSCFVRRTCGNEFLVNLQSMSDRIFYVAAQAQGKDETEITGYVPAKFLTLSGKPVVDPTWGGSQKALQDERQYIAGVAGSARGSLR